ncbi:MAG: AraC family transcriptional regulator [Desulfobacteraceae bacterium]|nr:MAG: AraC family transcriptional regulator [Desulfobacteraceae bacterium]
MHLVLFQIDSLLIFLLLGGFQGLLLALFLLTIRRGNRRANRVRGILVLIFSAHIIIHALGHILPVIRFYHLNDFIVISYWAFGPLILWYVRLLTVRSVQWTRTNFWQLLPFAAGLVLMIFFSFGFSDESFQKASDTINRLMLLHLLGYLVLAVRQIIRYAIVIKKTRSSWGNINLNWLRSFVFQSVLIWLSAMIFKFFDWLPRSLDFFLSIVSVYIYWNVYTSLRQPEILSIDFDDELIKKKYEKTNLDPERAAEYLQKIETAMNRDKLFLQNDISLPQLAGVLGMSVHHLSQIINDHFHQNFFEFINSRRVNEAQKRLQDPANDHLTVLAIGLDVGFNSSSAFNSAFKKFIDMTPSEARKNRS